MSTRLVLRGKGTRDDKASLNAVIDSRGVVGTDCDTEAALLLLPTLDTCGETGSDSVLACRGEVTAELVEFDFDWERGDVC